MGNRRVKKYKKAENIVTKLQFKYKSLHEACRQTDCAWTEFKRCLQIQKMVHRKESYACKLTTEQIRNVQEHIQSEEVSFPLPDNKYEGKMFMRTSMQCGHKLFNLLESTTHKISLATYFRLKPSDVKLQGSFFSPKLLRKMSKL